MDTAVNSDTYRPYDLVTLQSAREDVHEQIAYVTRIPSEKEGTKVYTLWLPGRSDEDSGSLFVYREGSADGDIESISLFERPPDASIIQIIQADPGRYIIGIPASDVSKRHILKVVRTESDAIYCVRQSDLTETVIRIPVTERGIGESSPYVFLMPTETRDAEDTDQVPTYTSEERDREIERLRASKDVTVIRTDLPEYIMREETIRTGGSRDKERLRGQIASAIGAIGQGSSAEHAHVSERVKDLILHETQQTTDGIKEVYSEDTSVLLRTNDDTLPEWVIPIDSHHVGEKVIATEYEDKGGLMKYAPHTPTKVDAEANKKSSIQSYVQTVRNALITLPAGTSEKGHEVTRRTPYILPAGIQLVGTQASKTSESLTTEPNGPVVITRVASPGVRFLNGDMVVIPPDRIQLNGVVVLPLNNYTPPSVPLVQSVTQQWYRAIYRYNEGSNDLPFRALAKFNNTLWSKPFDMRENIQTLVHPPDDLRQLLCTHTELPVRIAANISQLRESMSLPLHTILGSLPHILVGGRDETAQHLDTFGYTQHLMTHQERLFVSKMCEDTGARTLTQKGDITSDLAPIRIPQPKAMLKYAGTRNLTSTYPNTLALIGPWEAYHRIVQSLGDHGALLYTVRAIDEYRAILDQINASIAESRERREKIRENMARVQEELRAIDSKLRTLDGVAKHYESQKDVKQDNKRAKEGVQILWDESHDNDEMKHLYTGDRLRKVTGALLTKLQDEGTLPLDVTVDDIESTDKICPTSKRSSFGGLNSDTLMAAVKEDIQAYNQSLPADKQMTDERIAELSVRVVLGGRPVKDGDIALITRHLRTAAYRWTERRNEWVQLKEHDLAEYKNDTTKEAIDLVSGATTAAASASAAPGISSTYSHTLELNRQYRKLSKTMNDFELMMSNPATRMRQDDIKSAIETLFTMGHNVFDKRRRCILNNRVLDEAPFVYDMIDTMLRRRVEYNEPDDIPRVAVTATDLRTARLEDSLVIDEEQALYEAGLNSIFVDEPTEVKQIHPVGDIPDELISMDPRIHEAQRRTVRGKEALGFIRETQNPKDRMKRTFYVAIGILESILRIPLQPEEVSIAVTEADMHVDRLRTEGDALLRGYIFYMLLLMTRLGSDVDIPTVERIIPPPKRDSYPSYFYPPVTYGDDERMSSFMFRLFRYILSTSTGPDTPESFLSQVAIFDKKKQSDTAKGDLHVLSSRISKSSPAIIERSFRAQKTVTDSISHQEVMFNRALRRTGLWETIPVGYRPSPGGKLVKEGKRVLFDDVPLKKDTNGIAIRENASLSAPIQTPSLRSVLAEMDRERAEALWRVLYRGPDSGAGSIAGSHAVLYAPAHDFIGITRPRIPEEPITSAKVTSMMLEKSIPVSASIVLTREDIEVKYKKPDDTMPLQEYASSTFEAFFDTGMNHLGVADPHGYALKTLMGFGGGEATLGSDDANGGLRAELLSVHDALCMAVEELYIGNTRRVRYSIDPEQGGSYVTDGTGPIYGIHNRVTNLIRGIDPKRIETGENGGRLPVLTGRNSYYYNVFTLIQLLRTYHLHTKESILAFRDLMRNFLTTFTELPAYISRDDILYLIVHTLGEYGGSFADPSDPKFIAANVYISVLATMHDYEDTEKGGIVDDLRDMAADYTDVTPSMIQEEANKDREMERQMFIYRLDGLDQERKKITKALQNIGLTLEGRVAADPKRFNPEYYQQQSSIIAGREMATTPSPERTQEFGDAQDAEDLERAGNEAPTETEQIEGVDYD